MAATRLNWSGSSFRPWIPKGIPKGIPLTTSSVHNHNIIPVRFCPPLHFVWPQSRWCCRNRSRSPSSWCTVRTPNIWWSLSTAPGVLSIFLLGITVQYTRNRPCCPVTTSLVKAFVQAASFRAREFVILFASSVDAGNLSRMNSGGLSNLSIYRSIYPSIYLSIVIYILICIYINIYIYMYSSMYLI